MTDDSYGNGIYAVDAGYVRPKMAAVHLVVESGRVALIDTAHQRLARCSTRSTQELRLGRRRRRICLPDPCPSRSCRRCGSDDAGVSECALVVHPRGARHMIDPSRLVEGATAVYGADEMARLYGEIHPADAARVVEAHDGTIIEFGGRRLHVLDTPGHARHHVCFPMTKRQATFLPVTSGFPIPSLMLAWAQFSFGYHAGEVRARGDACSIDRLLALKPGAVYLTHFGRVGDPVQVGGELHRLIDAYVAIATRHRAVLRMTVINASMTIWRSYAKRSQCVGMRSCGREGDRTVGQRHRDQRAGARGLDTTARKCWKRSSAFGDLAQRDAGGEKAE